MPACLIAVGLCFAGLLSVPAFSTVAGLEAVQQLGTISGLVTDAATGQPLPSVHVQLEGTNRSAITNEAGRYTIVNVPPGTYTIVATVIGYGVGRRENVPVAAGPGVEASFRLTSAPLRLQDIVVTGVTDPTSGVKVPFVVGRVTSEDVAVPQLDALGPLQGRVAGVRMARGGGQPGEDFDILLRTPTSIMRDNAPMIVVDGVILGDGSLRDIDGLDIESIEVVKGAAAASMYGSRAAAGVIEIRTRTGSHIGRGETRFSLQTELGREEVPPGRRNLREIMQHHPYLINASGDFVNAQGQVVEPQHRVLKPDRIADQPYKQTFDNFGALIRPGVLQTTSFSMTQNAENTRFYGLVRSTTDQGVVRYNDGLSRQSFRLNLEHWPRSTVNLNMTGYFARTELENVADPNPFDGVAYMPPDFDVTAPGDNGQRYRAIPPSAFGLVQESNPLYNQYYNDSETVSSRFTGGVTASYAPVSWFRLEGNVGLDRSDRERQSFWPVGFEMVNSEERLHGRIDRGHSRAESFTGGLNARLIHRLGNLTLRHHARALYELEDTEAVTTIGRRLAASGIKNLSAASERQSSSNSESIRSQGYSAATGFDYADRFVGDVLIRRDGSSLFGPDDRWRTYFRVSAAYRLAQEQWWPVDFITEFKPRFSIGTAGGRPNFADRFETWTASSGGVRKQTLGNRLLRPEKATEQELGLDVILANRVSVQLTRATSKVEDQILQIPLQAVLGYTHQWQNAGTLEGTTYEATVEATLLTQPGKRWTVNATWDRSRHKITEFPFACYRDSPTGSTSRDVYYRCTGYSLTSIWGRKILRSHGDLPAFHASSHDQFQVNDDGYLVAVGRGNSWKDGLSKGLWGSTVQIDGYNYPWGEVIAAVDNEGNPLITEIGNSDPDFNVALGTRFEVGPFSFSALLGATMGGTIYNYEKRLAYRDYHGDYDQSGKPDERKKPVPYYGKLVSDQWLDYFLEDGSYLRLQELAASYRFTNVALLQRLGVQGAELSLMARNLYTWTRYTGWDPDVGSLHRRIREGAYPQLRVLSVGLRIDF